MLSDIYWVKFDDGDVECFCIKNRKKCPKEKKPICKEYVLKFIEVEREPLEELKGPINHLKRKMTEVEKSIKKFKII